MTRPARGRRAATGQRHGAAGSGALEERLAALDRLVELGEGRLDPAVVAEARAVRATAEQRRARGDRHVVVALCGGTGTGKSSLFNALAGADLSPVGARRPVTTEPRAWVVDGGAPEDRRSADALLSWLGVDLRHAPQDPAADAAALDGLVLVDLPDHDSIAEDHRRIVDRFVERVDVLVWVVDPVKYAHRSLHDGYLDRLAEHADVVLVVLNHADALDAAGRALVEADLRRLLEGAGLGAATVLATSARTGAGVAELRATIGDLVRSRHAVGARIAADVAAVGLRAMAEVAGRRSSGPPPPDPLRALGAALPERLAQAAGAPRVAAEAEQAYRRETRRRATTPLAAGAAAAARALARPVRGARGMLPGGGRPAATTRALTTVSAAAVHAALLDAVEPAAVELPPRGRQRLTTVVDRAAQDLPGALARTVDAVGLRPGRRRWWLPLAVLLSVAELVAVVGAGWLGVQAVLAYLQLPPLPVPRVTPALTWPTALLLGGLAARLGLTALRALAGRAGGRRHRRAVAHLLRAAVEEVSAEQALAPVAAELAAHRELAEAASTAAGRDR